MYNMRTIPTGQVNRTEPTYLSALLADGYHCFECLSYIADKTREKTLTNAHGQTIRFCDQDCKTAFLNQEGILTA